MSALQENHIFYQERKTNGALWSLIVRLSISLVRIYTAVLISEALNHELKRFARHSKQSCFNILQTRENEIQTLNQVNKSKGSTLCVKHRLSFQSSKF